MQENPNERSRSSGRGKSPEGKQTTEGGPHGAVLNSQLSLHLVYECKPAHCPTWFSFFDFGEQAGEDLFGAPSLKEALLKAIKNGLSHSCPVLVAQKEKGISYSLQLFPFEKMTKEEVSSRISDRIFKALPGPNIFGVYFPPTLISIKDTENWLQEILVQVLKQSNEEIHVFLYLGDYDMNTLINLILRIKGGLLRQNFKATLFH